MKTEREIRIENYKNGLQQIKIALAQVPAAAIDFKPSPEKWSVREIIIHLGDSEANSYVRLRKGIAESGSAIAAYDQDKWAEQFSYSTGDMEESISFIAMIRKMNSRVLDSMAEENWNAFFMHPESGKKTMEDWLQIYTDHIDIHAKQIARNIEAFQQTI